MRNLINNTWRTSVVSRVFWDKLTRKISTGIGRGFRALKRFRFSFPSGSEPLSKMTTAVWLCLWPWRYVFNMRGTVVEHFVTLHLQMFRSPAWNEMWEGDRAEPWQCKWGYPHYRSFSLEHSLNLTRFHPISLNLTQSHSISLNLTQCHSISLNLTQSHSISFNRTCVIFVWGYIALEGMA